eukprot:1087564_1
MGCLCSKSENESELANDDVIVTIHDEPYNVKPTGAILDMLPDMPPIAQNVIWALLVGLVMIVSIFILPALFRSGNGQQTNTVPIESDYGPGPIFKPELAPKTSDTIQFEYVKAQLEDHLSAEKEKANENTQANESETTHLSNKTPTIKSDDTVSGGSNGSQSTTPKQTVPKQSDSINRSHKTSEIKSDDTQADSDAIIFDDFSGSNGSQGTSPKHTVAKQSCSISGSYKTSEIQSGDTQADSESIIFNCFGDSNDSQGTSPKPVAEQSGDDANSNLIGTAAKVQNDDDLPSANNNDETFTNSNELSIESQIAKTTLDSNNSDQDIINSLPIEGTGGGPNMAASGANLGVLNSNKLKSNDDQLIQSSDKSVTLSTTGGQHANDVNGDEFEYYSDNSSEVVTSQSQPPLNTKPHGNVLARSTEPSTMSTGSHKPNDDNIPRSVSLPNIEPGDRYSLPTNLPSNELHSVPKTLAKQTSSSNIEFTNDTMSDCEIPKAQSSHLKHVPFTGLDSNQDQPVNNLSISVQNTNKFSGSAGHGSESNDANTGVSHSSVDRISTLISPKFSTSPQSTAFSNASTEEAATNSFAKQVTEEDTKQVTMSPIPIALSNTGFTKAPPQSVGRPPVQTTKYDSLSNEQIAKEVLKEVIKSVATTASEPESKPTTKQVMKQESKHATNPVTKSATGQSTEPATEQVTEPPSQSAATNPVTEKPSKSPTPTHTGASAMLSTHSEESKIKDMESIDNDTVNHDEKHTVDEAYSTDAEDVVQPAVDGNTTVGAALLTDAEDTTTEDVVKPTGAEDTTVDVVKTTGANTPNENVGHSSDDAQS